MDDRDFRERPLNINELKTQYEYICNQWIEKFSKKQSLEFTGWIGEVGEIASFIDQYYFNLSDIILDLTTKQKKWFILEWQDESVEHHEKGNINYKSYIMGLRYHQL